MNDDEGRDYCHRSDDACSGRSCWVCEVEPTMNEETTNGAH